MDLQPASSTWPDDGEQHDDARALAPHQLTSLDEERFDAPDAREARDADVDDTLGAYLREISRSRLLTKDEEVELHQHVDGSIPAEVTWDLMKHYRLHPVETLPEMRARLELQPHEEGSLHVLEFLVDGDPACNLGKGLGLEVLAGELRELTGMHLHLYAGASLRSIGA